MKLTKSILKELIKEEMSEIADAVVFNTGSKALKDADDAGDGEFEEMIMDNSPDTGDIDEEALYDAVRAKIGLGGGALEELIREEIEYTLQELIKEVVYENPNYIDEFINLTAEQLKNLSDRNIHTLLAGEDSMKGKYYRSYFVVNGKQVKYYNPIHNRSYFLQFVDYSMEDSIQNLLKRKNKIVSRFANSPQVSKAEFVGLSTRAILKKLFPDDNLRVAFGKLMKLPRTHPARKAYREAYSNKE